MKYFVPLYSGPFRWWIVPLAYVAHLVVLMGVSLIGVPAAFGQIAIFTGYALLATAVSVIVARSDPARALGMGRLARPALIVLVVVLAVGMTSLIERVGAYFSTDIAQSTGKTLAGMGLGTGDARDFLLIFTICCAAPLGEEAIFRGLIFKGLYDSLRRIGGPFARPWGAFLLAATISAIVFAQSHGGEGQEAAVLIALFLSAVIYALCYAVTGSLWTPVMAHALNNVLALVAAVLGSETVSSFNQMAILIMPFLTMGALWLWGRLMAAWTIP